MIKIYEKFKYVKIKLPKNKKYKSLNVSKVSVPERFKIGRHKSHHLIMQRKKLKI